MKCSDLQFELTLYSDGFLSEAETTLVDQHLAVCPLCRQRASEYHEVRSAVRLIPRTEIPSALRNRLKESAREQRRTQQQSILPVPSDIREWLQMRVLPYGVGVATSVMVAVTFLTMMFSGMLQPVPESMTKANIEKAVMLASNRNPFAGETEASFISPSDYAQTRLAFASESPSINPQGALIALTKSLLRGNMKDDEVVVVAEVFSNGVARITEVIEPSRDRQAIDDLEKALQSDPSYAPFVPSNMEGRPESMRVVLRIQSVDVSTDSKPTRPRSKRS